jgi:hypothetical protein
MALELVVAERDLAAATFSARCATLDVPVTAAHQHANAGQLQNMKFQEDRIHDMLKQADELAAVRVGVPQAG